MELITERLYDNVPVKDNVSRKLPKGRKRVAYGKMVLGLAFLGTYVVVASKHNFTVALQPWFKEQPLWKRIVLFQLYSPSERVKYYAVWTLTEGASILTGFGFTGFNAKGKSTWTGAANVIPLEIEFPSNFKGILDSWNMKTNIWLRECVYKRVTPKGKKPGLKSMMITSMTSAFWVSLHNRHWNSISLSVARYISRVLPHVHARWIHNCRRSPSARQLPAVLPSQRGPTCIDEETTVRPHRHNLLAVRPQLRSDTIHSPHH